MESPAAEWLRTPSERAAGKGPGSLGSAAPIRLSGNLPRGEDQFRMRHVADAGEAASEVLAVETAARRLVVVLEPVAADVARMVKTRADVFAEQARLFRRVEGGHIVAHPITFFFPRPRNLFSVPVSSVPAQGDGHVSFPSFPGTMPVPGMGYFPVFPRERCFPYERPRRLRYRNQCH